MSIELRDGVLVTDTDYGKALLDADTGEYFTLNPTAALIVSTLLDGGGPDVAVRALASEYQVDPAEAGRDVDDLIGQLRSAGLVRP